MADRISGQSQGFLQSVYDGIFKGDFSNHQSNTKTATQIGIGLVPIAGQLADARDTAAAMREVRMGRSGALTNLGFSLVGWIPAVGDLAKSLHRVGMKGTYKAIGGVYDSAVRTWGDITAGAERRMGKFGGLFYRPATKLEVEDLGAGTLGATNRWGDIEISDGLKPKKIQSTIDHENVHSFFSPKFKYGQELRANINLLTYVESHLFRRVEEGLAEGWARFKAKGFSGIAKGWEFPLKSGYGIDPERVKIERNILIGMGSSAIGTGIAISEAANQNQ